MQKPVSTGIVTGISANSVIAVPLNGLGEIQFQSLFFEKFEI